MACQAIKFAMLTLPIIGGALATFKKEHFISLFVNVPRETSPSQKGLFFAYNSPSHIHPGMRTGVYYMLKHVSLCP